LQTDNNKPAEPTFFPDGVSDHWRVYRLPGSRQWWLIDRGDGTPVIHVLRIDFDCRVVTRFDSSRTKQPIGWLEPRGSFYYVESERKAVFA